MDKNQILQILKKYNFDSDKYVIISSAALVLMGVKHNTKDIDISVTEDYYEYLLKNYECVFERKNEGKNVYYIDNIINFGTNYYNKNEYAILEGFPVQTLDAIRKLKLKLNREKDIEDIKLIDEFQRKRNL